MIAGSHWGVLGVAWGYLIAAAVEWPLSFWFISTRSTIAVRPLLVGALRILLVSGWVAAASWLAVDALSGSRPLVQLLAGVAAAAVAYASFAILPSYRRDIGGVLQLVRQGMGRRAR